MCGVLTHTKPNARPLTPCEQDQNRLFAFFAKAAALRVKPDGDSYAYLITQASRTEDYPLLRTVRQLGVAPGVARQARTG